MRHPFTVSNRIQRGSDLNGQVKTEASFEFLFLWFAVSNDGDVDDGDDGDKKN